MAFWESSVTVWGAEIYVVTDFFKIWLFLWNIPFPRIVFGKFDKKEKRKLKSIKLVNDIFDGNHFGEGHSEKLDALKVWF